MIYDADAADTVDLSGYARSEVTQAQSGNDLLLTLGANGTITLKDYYLGQTPLISFAPSLSRISIADASLPERDSGTTDSIFTVSLSEPSGTAITVDYATADGSAVAGSDYGATGGTLTFASGETSKTIAVSIIGDTLVENDEQFTVNLSAPSGCRRLCQVRRPGQEHCGGHNGRR